MDEYERVILVKSDVFIYRIPPRTTNRAHRASDWKLDAPDWNGRLRLLAKGKECILKLEEKASGQLFGKCPIDTYPSVAVEAVSDSSRYFVVRLQDDNGRNAFIGIGFSDRGDSFDLNVALQDYFKIIEKEEEIEKHPEDSSKPMLDLGFKEGQTIKVNLNIAKKGGSNANNSSRQRVKGGGTGGAIGLLPPPPSSAPKIPAPPKTSANQNSKENFSSSFFTESKQEEESFDFLLQLESLDIGSSAPNAWNNGNTAVDSTKSNDLWSDFASSNNDKPSDSANPISNSWAQF